jgi:N-methylhydantoinase B/oxoprolinase/acetone carboxylase alpha subunit
LTISSLHHKMTDPQARLQAAVTTCMDKLDRAYIRKLSKNAYSCMAACHDHSSYTSQDVQQCVGACSTGLQEINALISNELQYFQNRLQRCQQSCEDEVRDTQAKAGGGKPDPSQQAKLQGIYDKCVGKCVDTHLPLVNAMEAKLAGECKKRL